MLKRSIFISFAAAAFLCSGTQNADAAQATLADSKGKEVGTVTLTETPNGVLLRAEFKGLPAGELGFHVHETGQCTPPDFKSAGGHLAGGKKHGLLVEGGPHAGDMPNIHVSESGSLTIEVLNTGLSLDNGEGAVFDKDGSAVLVHAHADDYKSQPSGDAGDRIACGVIEK